MTGIDDAALLAVVAIGSAIGASALPHANWPRRSPAAAILLWQALGLAAGLAAVGTLIGLAMPASHIGPVRSVLQAGFAAWTDGPFRLTERNLAHTTVMTVLDRLAKKGFAKRERDGRAWRYCPAATRETYVTELMLTALDQTGDRTAALTRFAQSVSGVEAEVLRDALEMIEGSGEGDDGI